MKNYLDRYRRTFGAVGALVAFTVAVVYFIIIPEESSRVGSIQKLVLTYGHSICWILLGLASFLWSVKKNKWAARLAYTGLATYILFIGAVLFAG